MKIKKPECFGEQTVVMNADNQDWCLHRSQTSKHMKITDKISVRCYHLNRIHDESTVIL